MSDLRDFFIPYSRDPNSHLIVTGDITACGHPEEFDVANHFLGSVIPLGNGDGLGLEVPDWHDRAIPGNHDHWAGRPTILGRPSSELYRYFPNFPRAGPAISSGLGIRLLRINTDGDVNPFFTDRLSGRGRFITQLDSLGQMINLTGADKDELRVLCLHHSPSYRCKIGDTMEITEESRIKLREFVLKYRISVLLCGHIHRKPRVGPALWDGRTSSDPPILEVRCGTTTQLDPTLARSRDLDRRLDTSWQNSLFVHHIFDQSGEFHWQTQLFLQGRGAFLPSDRLRDDVPFSTEWKVWPWPAKQLS